MTILRIRFVLGFWLLLTAGLWGATPYDARVAGREILTPPAVEAAQLTGPAVFGVRKGKPVLHRLSATGKKPVHFSATGLPAGVTLDPVTGWVTGRAPAQAGDWPVEIKAENAAGVSVRKFLLRVGDEIALTPPLGWNSWYVHSEGVSDRAIRDMAVAMEEKGLADHGWTYINIDDCWMGLRDPETKAILPNDKFGDMKALSDFVHARGFKLGIYSTPWMSTYAGYIGGSAPNEAGDYSAAFVPEAQRENPHQLFGRFPGGIRRNMSRIGPVWFVDRDAQQFAAWGIDYVKYDWKEWTLIPGPDGYTRDKSTPQHKTEESGITKRVYDNFRAVDRDIVISLSPAHDESEQAFVPKYANLWRLTADIDPKWERIIEGFGLEKNLQRTRPGHYGDLDMLQIGPRGIPNRAEKVFTPSPLTPNEQYLQVTMWCVLTQPLLLSCNVPTMDAFDLGLVTNDEVLAINQDPLCRPARRVAHQDGEFEIWAKELADGSQAVALFNLAAGDRTIVVTKIQLGVSGPVRDLWRKKDVGPMPNEFSALVGPHGAAFLRVEP